VIYVQSPCSPACIVLSSSSAARSPDLSHILKLSATAPGLTADEFRCFFQVKKATPQATRKRRRPSD
jgi:hypothetical protein